MTDEAKPYYVEKIGDRYNIRQKRFRERYLAGRGHPYDLMAEHFTKEGMVEVIEKHFAGKVDWTEDQQ